MDDGRDEGGNGLEASDPVIKLTSREDDVMKLVCQGYGNKEIGRQLGISWETAKRHVYFSLAKLGAHSRTGAAVIYLTKVNPAYQAKCMP